jgi:hypothetical protein
MAMSFERTQKLLRDCFKILGPPYPPRHHEPEAEWPRSKEMKAADKLLSEWLRKRPGKDATPPDGKGE